MKREGLLALAVLVGAPAADTIGHGFIAGIGWTALLGLATATWICGRRLLGSGIAASVAAVIACAATAAAVPLITDTSVATLPQALLLALSAAAAVALPLRDLLRAAIGVAIVLTLTGACRGALPAMNASVAAALGLALLSGLLALVPPLGSHSST